LSQVEFNCDELRPKLFQIFANTFSGTPFMRVTTHCTGLPDVMLIEHEVYRDDRGAFVELFRSDTFREAGLPVDFAQFNQSVSARNVLRGLHMQWEPPMGKVMRVVRGRAFLVAVDIRIGSPGLGRWFGIELGGADMRQVWAPAGFARGFCSLEDDTEPERIIQPARGPSSGVIPPLESNGP
jgi:dTDP-4-dehydrorhamnose 3,5-epimerase